MIGEKEIWNVVPPEEKLQLLARSQVSGIYSCVMLCAVCFTLAIALKLQWLIWLSLMASPLVFQTGAARAWRSLKPRVLLEYLAARSVARRFAYAASAQGLEVELLFRGRVTEISGDETANLSEAIASIENSSREANVWIGLLRDAIVAFREGNTGGTLEFVTITDRRIEVKGKNTDDSQKEYSSNREVYLTVNKQFGKQSSYRITSDYPVALNVLEKKLQSRIESSKKAALEMEKLSKANAASAAAA